MDDKEIIREFLIESNENLARLDQEMVELEQRPKDPLLIASIFRTIHTIKGTCGFLGLSKLEAITHLAENLLSQVRDGKRELTPSLVTVVLEAVDATKRLLVRIEEGGDEGEDIHAAVRARLEAACGSLPQSGSASPHITALPASPHEENGAGHKALSVYDSSIRVDVALLDSTVQRAARRHRSQRHVTAAESHHVGAAGKRHENAHAAHRRPLEYIAPHGARSGRVLRKGD